MKTTLSATYSKNQFNQVWMCTITQDICTRLLGLLYTSKYQMHIKRFYWDKVQFLWFLHISMIMAEIFDNKWANKSQPKYIIETCSLTLELPCFFYKLK